MTETVNPRNLRVGDAEREHVVGLLQKAVGRGLLDIDEFTTRADTALGATTRGELNSVLVDLPGAEVTPGHVVLVGSCSNEIVRKGQWSVPGEVVVRNKWNSAKLDFTEARFPYPEIRLVLDTTGGAVELIMPEGAGLITDTLNVIWGGSIADKRKQPLAYGRPRFVVTGTLRMAPLTIKNPR